MAKLINNEEDDSKISLDDFSLVFRFSRKIGQV